MPLNILKKYWGYDSFRPLQREIIDSVLAGRDTLGLMPTGGGKSITFQVPGMILPGLTIVVTPLISLMKDQVDNLRRRRIKAVYLHSGMSPAEVRVTREKLFNDRAKFLYISPERLRNENFLAHLRKLSVSLIVVDEAHCISQWGYDFRPAYLNIKKLRHEKPGVPVLALTATATPEVADDICRRLEMSDPARLRMSFKRENINYIVRPTDSKIQQVFHILSRTAGSAIVYVRSRKRTADIADFLNSAGISAAAYHAGLSFELKEERQNDWIAAKIRVMVATNAFGMGIDKADVRVVIHFDMPPSLEEYYQEAGRAGRDGKTGYAVLLTSPADRGVMRRRLSEVFPSREYIKKVYERVCNTLNIAVGEGYDTLKEFDIDRFCDTFGYQLRQCRAALHLLGRSGYLEFVEESERRSRIMMAVDREELYDISGLSPLAERVLTHLLRAYTGLFSEYVPISESNICRVLNISERDLYESLLNLSRAKILNFIPRSSAPLIYVSTSREEPRYLQIPNAVYEHRREVMSRRIEAMIDYAFASNKCRENRLLEYFGESRRETCCRCDLCRANNPDLVKKPSDRIAQVNEYLQSHPDGVDIRILERDLRIDRPTLSSIISFLSTEGYITVSNNYILINKQ